MTSSRRNTTPDFYDDEREAARRRLERRRAAAASASGAASSKKPDSSSRRSSGASDASRSRTRSSERIDPLAHSVVGAPASVLTGGGIHIPRIVIIAAGVAVLLALFLGVSAIERSCSGTQSVDPIQVDGAAEPSANEAEPATADFSLLPSSLDADALAQLQAKESDSRVVKIVNNAQRYVETFGESRAVDLFELAAKDDEAIDFVESVLDDYPATSAAGLQASEVTKGTIPLFYQWDTRWGAVSYCAGPLGSTGCCPTSLAMVYAGLTGKTDKSPADMATLATKNGYAADDQGTYSNFLTEMAPELGLQCEQFNPSTQYLLTYLQSGYVVIVNVGPGDFTSSGHFLVVTGANADGAVSINDPYSSVNSATTWDPDSITNQAISMYAYRV